MSEVGLDQLMTVADAITVLDAVGVSPRTEQVALFSADGRVLAQDVLADRDYPPFDKSLMDGYAVRSVDAAVDGVTLRSVGQIAAGESTHRTLNATECLAIMTGAPLPPGADAVVPIERVSVDRDQVRLTDPVTPGQSVARRGSEVSAGQTVLTAGHRLGAAQLAACAQVGAARVRVTARPRVGIVSSGNEVIPFDQSPRDAQIRDANSILLTSLIRRFGAEPIDLGHVADDPAQIAAALSQPGVDVLLVSGGMSMGAHDYTSRLMRELGYDLRIKKLKIKPGKPFVMGVKTSPAGEAASFIFGLPGNPVSAFVCTLRLVSRVLLRMQGLPPDLAFVQMTLGAALPRNGPREFYQPAIFDGAELHPLAFTGSADVFTLARANCLLRRFENEGPLSRGSIVQAFSF